MTFAHQIRISSATTSLRNSWARRLRINRREVKQVYNKYKPKKRQVPPPAPFAPEEQFLDFVALLDPLASALSVGGP